MGQRQALTQAMAQELIVNHYAGAQAQQVVGCSQCGRTLSERRERADVQGAVAKLTKEVTYETACELLADLTGITVSVHTAHEVTDAIAAGLDVLAGKFHARARAGESGPGDGGAKTATDSGAGDGRGRRGDAPAAALTALFREVAETA